MTEIKLGLVEGLFADLIWENAPMTTKSLVTLCQQELNWKRTTTYTVLKKLCNRGIFALEDGLITVQISKDRFVALQSQQYIVDHFQGSLPAFLAAFTSCRTLSQKEIREIKELIDSFGEE